MPKSSVSKEKATVIRANYLIMGSEDIGKLIGLSKCVVQRYKRQNSLIVPTELSRKFAAKKLSNRTTLTPEQDQYIVKHYLSQTPQKIADRIGGSETRVKNRIRQLGLVIPRAIIDQRIAESRRKPGDIPFNKGKKITDWMSANQIANCAKTRFKKGNQPHNTKFDGAERITKDGYVEVRISKGVYKLKHRVEWEKVNDPIGDNILTCKSDDKTNCHPHNWQLITRAEHAINNSHHDNPTDNRVASYLATTSKKMDRKLRQIVLQHPQIIDTKRTQLLLNRKINTLTTNLKKHGKEQNTGS